MDDPEAALNVPLPEDMELQQFEDALTPEDTPTLTSTSTDAMVDATASRKAPLHPDVNPFAPLAEPEPPRGSKGGMTAEQLMMNLHCRKCDIISARPIGEKGTAVVTFKGTSLPYKIGLKSFTIRVYPFKSQEVNCFIPRLPYYEGYGFPEDTVTPDIMIRLKEGVLDVSSSCPRIVVGVDIRKAFDSLPHASIMQAIQEMGIKGNMHNFIAAFLQDRTFQVQVGSDLSSYHHNGVGVPQGAVISPTLFNIVLAALPAKLETITSIEHAIYADDVTLWITRGSLGEREEALQTALNTIESFTREIALTLAPEKTEISKRTRGVQEKEMRHFVQAFLHSRILYGAPFHPITRTQLHSLERLNNEARRVMTVLPKYTPLSALKSCSALGDIADLISMHEHTHVTRLKSTNAGRATLVKIGHDISNLPALPRISPPWEHVPIADPKPLPKNMGQDQLARRQAHAKRHKKYTQQLREWGNDNSGRCHIVYVDASIGGPEEEPMFTTAWTNMEATERGSKLHLTRHVVQSSTAELYAILDFAKHAEHTANKLPRDAKHHYKVFTDSQNAFRACQDTRTTTAVVQQLRLHVRRLRDQGHDFQLHWIPGHTGIPGNERAHRLARATLLSALSKPPEQLLNNVPEDTEIHSQWYDPMEAIAEAKRHRRSYLFTTSNPMDIPPLPSQAYTRRQQVLLRQVQTGTLLTPFLVQRFRRKEDRRGLECSRAGTCSPCNTRADLEHLIWDCPLYSGPRQRALASLPTEWRPTSLQTWALARYCSAATANELWRSLYEFLDDPEPPATGTRLLHLERTSESIRPHDVDN
ncbi:uncharacterized protein [Dermacentor andersoni]|uniref:uncharacterized protein n=1 Tax=Dermacentor andersoni TaxID=34620 RepID=UPI003B3B2A04